MHTYPKSHVKAALLLSVLLTVVIAALPAHQGEILFKAPAPGQLETPEATDFSSVNKPVTKQEQERVKASNSNWIKLTIKPGDNLARIFQRNKLPAAELQNIVNLGKPVSSLRKILPGQELGFKIAPNGELLAIRYKKNAFDTLLILREGRNFVASWESATSETIIAFESAKITNENPSLYHAGKAAGLSDNIIMKLSHIYQWDISFALDLRAGDSFNLMFEKIYIDGEVVKEGSIIAATFTNSGNRHDAVKYTDIAGHSDYYTPEGLSMRKAFLRDPVHFSHVSSSFNLRRLHPVHKRVMPHRGIDYAAKRGTPVVASGEGKVTTRRQNNASGKYIVIQHGEQYTTKYLHLSAFGKGIRPGKFVKQGQTIGYVGATGWATGAHLHYEFLVNGVHRNPKTVSLPKALPISKDELKRFKNNVSPALAQLESLSGKGYASLTSSDRSSGG
jgi:murein DD-endopeptidase MepM/ murein hydrolase activator NlpD